MKKTFSKLPCGPYLGAAPPIHEDTAHRLCIVTVNKDAFSMILPIILAGGSGTRLWPLSRKLYPKQLISFSDDGRSLLQKTILRLAKMDAVLAPLVICNEEHRFLVAEQLLDIGVEDARIILEPAGRNTAPAVAIGAMLGQDEWNDDPVLLVLPADHRISREDAFRDAMCRGAEVASAGRLVTFGIVPDNPHTGFGYIKKGAPLEGFPDAFAVDEFREKPDRKTAQGYIDDGSYLWNSGIFMFRGDDFVSELGRYAPEVLDAASAAYAGRRSDLDFVRLGRDEFLSSPNVSIDYAVMEHTSSAAVIPVSCGWSDLGSWSTLWETGEKDDNGNVLQGDVVSRDTKGSIIFSSNRLVATSGVRDLVLVETADAVLVASRENAQDVKEIVARLNGAGRDEAILHRRVYRPWGSYECIDRAERFQVKRITVKPGASLSLQMHYHRAEHWIVVKGTARIQRGDETLILTENQSTYIPLGQVHRLENPGVIPLELIEVQSGSYLGEDDIVRFEDHYGRDVD